jgi:hypothetical protein
VPAGTPLTDELVLQTDFDDGFIAWIDGVLVDNQGLAAELAWDNTTTTVSNHEASFGDNSPGAVRTTVIGTVVAKALPGAHVLAVQLANSSITSSDAALKMNLFTQTPVAPPDLHWELAESPIILTTTFNVTATQELLIDAGVEVRCHSDSDAIACAGKITANGTQAQPIRFVRAAAGSAWRRIVLSGTQETSFRWCDFDSANTSGTIRGDGISTVSPSVVLEHCRFLNTDVQMVDLVYTSCDIVNCQFDSIGPEELVHFSNMPSTGHALIKGCRFGLPGVPPTSGYNDIIDFTGGNRPGPIPRFIDNIFLSSADDCFDMDATDAHIEGNVFLNVLQGEPRASSSNPITTGEGSAVSELVICRNFFYPTDPADAARDADGDGQTSAQEYIAGTHPQDPNSRLTATAVRTPTPGEIAITFNTVAGKGYTVRFKADLTGSTWTTLQHFAPQPTNGTVTAHDTPPAGTLRRFCQVVTPQQPSTKTVLACPPPRPTAGVIIAWADGR